LCVVALKVFGLTGGIGSGKSSVARHLRARGLAVVDADELSRLAVAPGSRGLQQIVHHFGAGVLRANGELDRAGLGKWVFSSAEARAALDAIVHPIVRRLAAERLQELERRGEPLACYEVPLLYEAGLEQTYQPVVVVTAGLEQRKRRIATRDGLDDAQIQARISAQMPLEDKCRRAAYVIDNSGSPSELAETTDAVFDELCRALDVPAARYPRAS